MLSILYRILMVFDTCYIVYLMEYTNMHILWAVKMCSFMHLLIHMFVHVTC